MLLKGLVVGVPREVMAGERRVAAIPETVRKMVGAGARVLVEAGAGKGAFFEDEAYGAAGAEVVSGAGEVYRQAGIVLKVKEPQFHAELGRHEAELLAEGSVLISFLHPANAVNHEMVQMLARRGITSLTMDSIPRISRAQQMDALTFMSTVAGYKAVIFAANHLGRFIPMLPTPFGIIPPAKFLVLGTGVAGLQTIANARRLGAKVKALDIRPEANEQAKSLGAEIVPFDLPPELAAGEGGYARRLPAEWYEREREILGPVVKECDAIVLSALIPGEEAPVLIDKEMVRSMKKGSIIVDVSVDQGGNCEVTRAGEEYDFEGVTISGIMNIPATLAIDATSMYAQAVCNFLTHVISAGELDSTPTDEIVREAMVTQGGKIVHRGTLLAMGK